MGRQTIETEAGRFEGCLVVRYTGVLAKRGRSEIAGIGLPTGGRVTTTEWYARGVGLVRSKRSGTIDLTLRDGAPGKLYFEHDSGLYQYQIRADQWEIAPLAALAADIPFRPGAGWAIGDWRLGLDPNIPLSVPLPMDVVRFRLDGKVDLSKRTRVYASCPYAVYGDILTLNCSVFGESLVRSTCFSTARSILTNSLGGQYSKK